MKRFAAHFIFLPGYGYLKQYVVEVVEGQAVSVFPLTEEIESAEWFPGVIALLSEKEIVEDCCTEFKRHPDILNEPPPIFRKEAFPSGLMPCLFYPFDFTEMRPADGIRHKQLQ